MKTIIRPGRRTGIGSLFRGGRATCATSCRSPWTAPICARSLRELCRTSSRRFDRSHKRMRNKSPERLGPSPVIALLLCATLMSLDCDSPTTPRRARTTFLSYSSDSGDFIGQGQSHRYVLSDGQWRANFDTYLTYIEH